MKAYNLETAIRKKEHLTQLCIHRRKLPELPSLLLSFPKLRSLELSHNQLTELPVELLQLPLLEELIISHNQLQTFPGFLSQLPKLRVLNLNANRIKAWPANQTSFKQLEQLFLSKNQIQQLPSLEYFKNLKVLDLSANQIKEIPDSIARLQSLRKLFLQYNQIRKIPEQLTACKQLSELYLQHNKLQQLPIDLGQFDQLYRLHAFHNKIAQLPDSISSCRFLNDVDLSHNQLQQLPPHFTACLQLRELRLSHNQLSVLPSPSAWTRLRKWILDSNQIKELPEGIKDLQSLEQLSIRKNPVKGFVPELLHLSRLRQLQGLLPAADGRRLVRFLNICKKKQVAFEERKILYSLLQGESLHYPQSLLLKAAGLGLKALRAQAIHQLINQYSLPLAERPLSKNAVVSLLGRSRFKLRQLEEALQKKSIPFQRKVNPTTTHLILGQRWEDQAELPKQQFVLLREEQLFDLLSSDSSGYLHQASSQQLARLRTLLCSREDARIEMALQMLKGGGLPSALFTEVFIAWKTAKGNRLRNELQQLLSWNVNEATRSILSSRWSLSEKVGKEKRLDHIRKYAAGTQLDEVVLMDFFVGVENKNG